jgi:DNA-binding NarL/FixJ family response regulator
VRVVLAEDNVLLRDGLIRLLGANGFDVVDAVDTGPLLLDALLRHRPDVAVVDVRMPPTFTDEGLRAALDARRAVPGLPVLVLSQYVEQLYARELLADPGEGWATCSRTGWATSTSSSTRCAGWPAAGRRWTAR